MERTGYCSSARTVKNSGCSVGEYTQDYGPDQVGVGSKGGNPPSLFARAENHEHHSLTVEQSARVQELFNQFKKDGGYYDQNPKT